MASQDYISRSSQPDSTMFSGPAPAGGWRARLNSLTGRAKTPDPSSARSRPLPRGPRDEDYFTDGPSTNRKGAKAPIPKRGITAPTGSSKAPLSPTKSSSAVPIPSKPQAVTTSSSSASKGKAPMRLNEEGYLTDVPTAARGQAPKREAPAPTGPHIRSVQSTKSPPTSPVRSKPQSVATTPSSVAKGKTPARLKEEGYTTDVSPPTRGRQPVPKPGLNLSIFSSRGASSQEHRSPTQVPLPRSPLSPTAQGSATFRPPTPPTPPFLQHKRGQSSAPPPPLPPLPSLLRATVPPSELVRWPSSGQDQPGSLSLSHVRSRSTSRAEPRSTTPRPSTPKPKRRMSKGPPKPPYVSDTDSDPENPKAPPPKPRNRTFSFFKKRAKTKPQVPRGQALLQQLLIPYPLSIGPEARPLEKYVYRTLYYVAEPYNSEKYCGPSFHEDFADKPPKNVLDVGAGYWYWLRDASAYWKHTKFVAFDYYELPHCDIPNDQLKRITFVQGDLLSRQLPLEEGQFDYIRLANMRLAIPDAEWEFVLWHLSKLLCHEGILELVDDGWMPPAIPRDSPVDHVFLRPYERLFEKMLMSRGFICKLNIPEQWEIVIEGYVERTPGMEFVSRGAAPVMPFDLDRDSELRWHRIFMLSEDAIRHTLGPQIADLHRSAPETPKTLAEKHEAFRSDLEVMVDRVSEHPEIRRYDGSTFHVTIARRKVESHLRKR